MRQNRPPTLSPNIKVRDALVSRIRLVAFQDTQRIVPIILNDANLFYINPLTLFKKPVIRRVVWSNKSLETQSHGHPQMYMRLRPGPSLSPASPSTAGIALFAARGAACRNS